MFYLSRSAVLAVNSYSFADAQDPNRIVSGLKLTFFDATPASGNTQGVNVVTISGAIDLKPLFSTIPAIYDLDLGVQMSKGKPVLKLNGAKYLAPLDVPKLIGA